MDSVIHNASSTTMPTLDIPRPSTPTRSRTPSPSRDGHTLYFAYGSNLWHQQMKQRCPTAQYLGIGRLRHWQWQINTSGYANIVEAPAAPYSPATAAWLGPLFGTDDLREDNERVYGMVWRLGKGDEERLDSYEDVGTTFTKEDVWVEFWGKKEDGEGKRVKPDFVRRKPQKINAMVYVSRENTEQLAAKPSGMYRYKLNMGIKDALTEGFPQKYVDQDLRPFVPMVDEQKAVTMAIEDFVKMGIDVQAVLKKTEEKLAMTGAKQEREMQVSQESLGKYLQGIVTETNGEQKGGMADYVSRGRALSSAW